MKKILIVKFLLSGSLYPGRERRADDGQSEEIGATIQLQMKGSAVKEAASPVRLLGPWSRPGWMQSPLFHLLPGDPGQWRSRWRPQKRVKPSEGGWSGQGHSGDLGSRS